MSEQLPAGEQFVERWFDRQSVADQLDHEVLSVIEEHRDGAALAEDLLLRELVALAEGGTRENAEA